MVMLICIKAMDKKGKSSSTKIPSWQVKGVSFETREAVKKAARKSGRTIGQWTNEALHKAAIETITGQQTLPAHRLEKQLSEISDKLDTIDQPLWRRIFRV